MYILSSCASTEVFFLKPYRKQGFSKETCTEAVAQVENSVIFFYLFYLETILLVTTLVSSTGSTQER